jgi:enolase
MPIILALEAIEILDSRGRPTVRASCVIDGGARGFASVPSGRSTGRAEALELRDGDPARYRGFGCRKAVALVEGEIRAALVSKRFADQAVLDRALLQLDASEQKSRLGANTLLAVSLAFARAHAAARATPLHLHLCELAGQTPRRLPRPLFNLFSGARHDGHQAALQDLLLVPTGASIDECLAATYAVHQCAAELVERKYGQRPLSADEGELAPPFASSDAMFEDALAAIRAAGLEPGRDMFLAIDVAGSHVYADGRYTLDGAPATADELIARIARWVAEYPLVSVEDGLAEEDWDHWPLLREAIGDRALVVGDDLLCTNVDRIKRAVRARAASALVLKANQVGTLTEAAEALRTARQHGWAITASARSGETEDDWLADLAVGWGADQLKVGALTRSERLAKYNRLLAIERETRWPLAAWPRA